MEAISKEAILSKTHYGIGIYAHILRLYYPGETVLSLSGRTCSPAKNPFNADKPTLNIFIEKENILGNAWDKELARHLDSENAIHAGDAFDFAEQHYKQSGDELLQTLNKEMNLHIGEKFDFYKNRISNTEIQNLGNHHKQINHSSDIVVRHFSFFKAPIRNTIPHKLISLLDTYNYIVGDYAKQRTEKLRSIKDPKQARQFKASTFDYCTFSGMFQTRNDKALISHSGLLCIDFDHLQNVDLLRKQLLQDEYFETQLLFVSPSGDGIKWIIQISPPVGDLGGFSHSNYFAAVANYILQTYGVEVDKSGRDISRACFLPHDPLAYINPLYQPSTL
jgi:hypothetical protein